MKDIVIAVDFTDASLNAVRYAAHMLSGRQDIRLFLYNMFSTEKDDASSAAYLESLKTEMLTKGVTANIECIREYGEDLVDSLTRLAHQKSAELVIMGAPEKKDWTQLFSSSQLFDVIEKNVCPVMIIPPSATFRGIKNIALTSDFEDVEANTPLQPIKSVLEMFDASLHIVNVDERHYVALSDEFQAGRGVMQRMFAEFNPEFYFIGMFNFLEAIGQFTRDREIDLIVVIPKTHSFIDRLFGGSNTEKLAYQSTVPLLAAHE